MNELYHFFFSIEGAIASIIMVIGYAILKISVHFYIKHHEEFDDIIAEIDGKPKKLVTDKKDEVLYIYTGLKANNIALYINGVCQKPGSDYYYDNGVIRWISNIDINRKDEIFIYSDNEEV